MLKQEDRKAQKALYSFDSMHEVSRYLQDTPRVWKYKESTSTKASQSWDLSVGYAGAWKLANEGWIEGAERAQEALRAFRPQSPNPDQKVDFFGHMPHVPRFCAGAPDSMFRHTTPPTLGGGKVITLYVSVAIKCGINAQHAANYGIAIAQYINQLENDGMRVELYAVHASSGRYPVGGWRLATTVKLKSADQPLDLATIVFAIGHPAMARRIGFAVMERSVAPASAIYMYPGDVVKSDVIDFPPHGYILNGINQADRIARTPADALEHIGKEIDKAIELQEGVI